jgi:O-antigen ligase
VTTRADAVSRPVTLALGVLAVLPILVWYGLRVLGYDSLLILAAVAVIGAIGAAILFISPRWGVYGLVFWVYSGMGLYSPIDAAPLILAVVFLSTIIGLIRGDRNRMTDGVFWIATAFFVLLSLQSGLFAEYPDLTLLELYSFAKALAVVIVIVQLIRTPDHLRLLGYSAFVGAVATVAIGILAIQHGKAGLSYIGGVDLLRFSGSHGDPNKAASIMCSALPFGLFAVYHERRVWKLLAVAGVITLIVAIFSTFSRGALFSFAVLVAAFVLREIHSRRSFLILVGLILVGVLLTPGYYWNRVFHLGSAFKDTTLDWSVYTRLLALKTAVQMFVRHPLTGIGLGNFIESSSYRLFIRIVAHNTYLEIAVGVGIFGLVAFLGMMGAGVRHAWDGSRSVWAGRDAWLNSFSFYCFLSLVSIAISGIFLTFPFRYPLWVPVAAGLVIGNLRHAETQPSPAP